MKSILEAELQTPLKTVFKNLAAEPEKTELHTQSYRGILRKNNVEVVIKIQRPDLRATLVRDLRIFETLSKVARRFPGLLPPGHEHIVRSMKDRVPALTDLRHEAATLRRMRKTLKRHKVYSPKVFAAYSRTRVLVREHIAAPSIEDFIRFRKQEPAAAQVWLNANQIILTRVARRLYSSMLRQVCEDNLFHVDLSPSNLLLLRGSRLAIAGGEIPGTLDKRYLTSFFLFLRALHRKNYVRVTDYLFLMCDPLRMRDLSDARAEVIRTARAYSARAAMIGASHREKSLLTLVYDLSAVLERHQITLNPQVTRLLRMMASVDGSMAQLFPEADYQKLLSNYFRRALRRSVHRFLTRGLQRIACDIAGPLTEMMVLQTASMRQRAQTFAGEIGKAAQFFAGVMRLLGGLVFLQGLVIVWFLTISLANYTALQRRADWYGQTVKWFHQWPAGLWLLALLALFYLHQRLSDFARRLEERELPPRPT
jgi:ubiquinone biosynthesis protein